MFGQAIGSFPYVFQAFKLSGESGIFKEKIKFQIRNITADKITVYSKKENQNTHNDLSLPVAKLCSLKTERDSKTNEQRQCIIDFVSPFRYQNNNKVLSSFSYSDILSAAFRKAKIMIEFYGLESEGFK